MNKILLTLLLFGFYANANTHVQITFVDGFHINIINNYIGSPSEGSATTDSEINTIFTNHSVHHCVETVSNNLNIIFADYEGENLEDFINDLQNNSNVSKVQVTLDTDYSYTFADIMYLTLTDDGISPIEKNSNGNVITNNASLNVIFDSYNVKNMERIIPTAPYYTIFYIIYFEGDIKALNSELNNLPEIIATTNTLQVPMLLSNKKFIDSKASIFPNPFSTTFTIDTKETISNYSIYDLLGKRISVSNSKSDLDSQVQNLSPNIYVLKLETDKGAILNQKLIKQ